jgi:hypothetical protein
MTAIVVESLFRSDGRSVPPVGGDGADWVFFPLAFRGLHPWLKLVLRLGKP